MLPIQKVIGATDREKGRPVLLLLTLSNVLLSVAVQDRGGRSEASEVSGSKS